MCKSYDKTAIVFLKAWVCNHFVVSVTSSGCLPWSAGGDQYFCSAVVSMGMQASIVQGAAQHHGASFPSGQSVKTKEICKERSQTEQNFKGTLTASQGPTTRSWKQVCKG
eukprot:2280776-Amphidinium_carterae.1